MAFNAAGGGITRAPFELPVTRSVPEALIEGPRGFSSNELKRRRRY